MSQTELSGYKVLARVSKKQIFQIIPLVLACLVQLGCKQTNDLFTSRMYHQTVSKFNPLFNGEQALFKGQAVLEDLHQDNFDEILPVFKLGSEEQASSIKPEMEKAIEKGAKIIQRHSMMIRNRQRNNFIDDAYLLIGKARYYKREYLPALETFNYVIQEFGKEKMGIVARYWLARTKTISGNYLSAVDDFEEVYRHPDLPKNLKGDVYAAYAQLEIDQKHYAKSCQLLREAIENTREKEKKTRWIFIAGQLQARLGNNYEASEFFRRVIKKGPPYELLFHAQLNRARNYYIDIEGSDKVFDELKDMLRDDKNYDNRDQIYYVMAKVAEKVDKESLAEDYLKKSIRVSTTNITQKGLSYLKLGERNFENWQYLLAAAYFDSALTSLPPNHKRYKEAKKKGLNELVQNLNVIAREDSLQQLAGLSEKQRIGAIEQYIEKLKEAEELKHQEEEDPFNNFAFNTSDGGDGTGSFSKGGQWYFYNSSLRSVGVRDFMNRFGNRTLEDNWRRSKKSIQNFDEGNQIDKAEEKTQLRASGNKKDEYSIDKYLENIPLTEKAMAASHKKIIKAFMNLGTIYKEEIKDFRMAVKKLEELLRRYPELEEKGRVWYTLYRIHKLDENEPKANYYKNLILSQMNNSEYANLIHYENENKKPTDRSEAKVAYVTAYDLYKDKKYSRSLQKVETEYQRFIKTQYGPKFLLLRAYNLAHINKSKLQEALKAVIQLYPETPQAKQARLILNQMGRGSENNETTAKENKDGGKRKEIYAINFISEHRYIVVVPNKKTNTNQLSIDITDFNAKFFSNDNLKTKTIFLDPDNQMVMVNGFSNSTEAMVYYNTVLNQKILVSYLVDREFMNFVISTENFQPFYRDKKVEKYVEFFKRNYLKQKERTKS